MPPAYVKPYVKRHKNDATDAEAICEAVTRPNMRFVATKTPEQQSCLTLHRTWHLFIRQQTSVINAIRAVSAAGSASIRNNCMITQLREGDLLELHHNINSVCAQKVRIALKEKGQEAKEHLLTLRGDQHDPEYLKLNPNAVVPTLVHDREPITELALILYYIDDAFPEPPLMPRRQLQRDNEWIEIGERTNVQDNCTLHTDPGYPLAVGPGCTIGHNAILHGCTIGANSLVGVGAILLNGAKIGNNCVVGAGALVRENQAIPDNAVVVGSPARKVRDVDDAIIKFNELSAEIYFNRWQTYAATLKRIL